MKLCPKCHKQFSDDANFCPVCAARLQPIVGGSSGADSLASRFELGAPLGGMRTGPVYKAVDKTNGDKAVAIKIISPAVVALPGVAQRLERELKQLERVSSAGVAKVLASGKRTASNGQEETWVAVEVLDDAQTLAQAINTRGAIGVAEAAQLVEVIGEALIEAAQVGVVHRDLAPKNVLFAGQDVKLINFSLPVPTAEKTAGVAEFVAPEQAEGKPVDQRSNLYSLGALYYYVLTGKTLAPGESPAFNGVPAPVEQLITRALDKSPTKRFLTVRQFVDEVGRVARGDGDNVKSTMPMGKIAGQSKPKGELVQTLLGVRLTPGALTPAAAPAAASPSAGATLTGAAIASAPTVGGVSALQPSVLAPPAPAPAVQAMDATAPAPIIAAPDVPVPTPNAPMPVTSTVVGLSGGVMVAPAPSTSPAPAPSPEAAPAAAPAAVVATSPAERSPWAPAPAAASAVVAPVVAAPVVAKPKAAEVAPAAGKKKAGAEEKKAQKGKFRETMWFKKGELDAAAADSAAQERMRTGKDAGGDKADSLPIDERYKDDGSLSTTDADKYSLRTGATQMMAKISDRGGGTGGGVSNDELIGEMKSGRNTVLIVIAVVFVLLVVVVIAFTR
jgi:serine/threonine-protein kinase